MLGTETIVNCELAYESTGSWDPYNNTESLLQPTRLPHGAQGPTHLRSCSATEPRPDSQLFFSI